MEGTGIHWSEMYSHKRELNGRYPTIWDVPTAKKMTDVLASALTGKDRLLDVGAFERGLEGRSDSLKTQHGCASASPPWR